jgi:ribonuclease HII
MVDLKYEREAWEKGFQAVAGVDEVGRGPLAGPVVAAAVIFPKEFFLDGVNDSKKLTERRRESLFEPLCSHALAFGIGIISREEIDRINILQATFAAMHSALAQLSPSPDFALIDGNAFHHDAVPFQTIVGGDAASFTIAAASIIAKVTRDRMMCEWDAAYPQYGFAKHKGYGTKFHIEAIKQYGLCPLHRRSFTSHIAVSSGSAD